MPAFADAGTLARRLLNLGEAVKASQAADVAEAALIVRASVATAAGAYATSPLARTAASLKPGPTPSALVAMTNRKAHLLDHDTRAHDELPGADTGRRKRRLALATKYGPVASVHHPGTKGKLMWETGVDRALPVIEAMRARRVVATLAGVLRP